MSFLKQIVVDEVVSKLTKDLSSLGKIYKAKKSKYYLRSVEHTLVEDMIAEGWEEYSKPLKTRVRIRKLKDHSTEFEDDVWCQFYELGYRFMNYDNKFYLPYGKEPEDKKQLML